MKKFQSLVSKLYKMKFNIISTNTYIASIYIRVSVTLLWIYMPNNFCVCILYWGWTKLNFLKMIEISSAAQDFCCVVLPCISECRTLIFLKAKLYTYNITSFGKKNVWPFMVNPVSVSLLLIFFYFSTFFLTFVFYNNI